MLSWRTATGCPSTSASTSTSSPCSSTQGARMNTARSGPPASPSTSSSVSKLATWRPNALRRAVAPSSASILPCASKSPWRARTPTTMGLPAAVLDQSGLSELGDLDPRHGRAETAGGLRDPLRLVVVGRRLDDRGRAPVGVLGLEDPRANEHALGAELHHQRGVRRRGEAPGGEVHDGQTAALGDVAHQVER